MLPPLAVDLSASVEISAPLFISKRTAQTMIEPASPLPVDRAAICGPGSGNTISEATMISTSPPLPGPAVELAICAPPSMAKPPALPSPSRPGQIAARSPKRRSRCWIAGAVEDQRAGRRHIDRAAGASARRRARDLRARRDRDLRRRDRYRPAFPLAVGVAEATISVPGPLKVSGPSEVTCTVPPLPAPVVLDAASAPPDSAIAPPAISVTSPAGPLDPWLGRSGDPARTIRPLTR